MKFIRKEKWNAIREKFNPVKQRWGRMKEKAARILSFIPVETLRNYWQHISAVTHKISIVMQVLLACLINFIIEALSRHSVAKAWTYMTGSPWVFLFNAYIIFATLMITYVFRRRTFVRVIFGGLWLVIGGFNCYMLSVRVTPFNAQDLKVVDDAVTMLDKYFTGFQGAMIISGIVLMLVFLIFVWRHGRKQEGKIHRVIAAIGTVLCLGAIVPLTSLAIDKRVVSNYFGNIAFAYEDYGLPYCFGASLLNTGISQPSTYSEDTMEALVEESNLTEVSSDGDVLPNIIVIQLESFFDVDEVEFFTTSEDPLPTFHYLMENYSSGYFKVPSVGAGTANTEFEVLTGMSMRYFGPGEYPYKTIAKYEELESAATALREFGYGAHALHNNGGNFYSRADVFEKMGFDDYTSKEFMNILQYTENGWAKDRVLTQHILNALDSTEQQDFVFGITVEGHGDYNETVENPRITVEGIEDEDKKNSWEYYVNHLYETDQFIASLISELEERDEPTVLVLYGDHLPTMGLEAKDLKNRYLYNTNYVIWNNFGMEKISKNLSSYQLMATVFERLGIHSGTLFNYHQQRRQSQNYLSDLELLQYDMLYGEGYVYGGQAYVTNRIGEYQMGILDVNLFGMQANLDGTYSLYGENMTANSKIYVNGEKQSTQFLNNTRIELQKCELEEGDVIVVSQVGSSSRVFRSTVEYVYSQGKLVLASEYEPPSSEEENSGEETSGDVSSGEVSSDTGGDE